MRLGLSATIQPMRLVWTMCDEIEDIDPAWEYEVIYNDKS